MKAHAMLFTITGLVLAAATAGASSVTVAIGSVSGKEGQPVAVPVSVREAQHLGALRLDLRYPPEGFEVQKVESGKPGFPSATVSHRVIAPGRLRVVMNSPAGESLSGDGELFRIVGAVKGAGGSSCDLVPEAVRAWDNVRPDAIPAEMLVNVEPGRITVAAAGLFPRRLVVIAGGAVGALLMLVVIASVRKRPRPAR